MFPKNSRGKQFSHWHTAFCLCWGATHPWADWLRDCHVALLKGIAPEDQVVFLAGMPLEDEATLHKWEVEALTTLEVVCCLLGDKVCGSLACAGKVRPPMWPNRRKRRRLVRPNKGGSATGILLMLYPPLARTAPMPTLKSLVILAFSYKAT